MLENLEHTYLFCCSLRCGRGPAPGSSKVFPSTSCHHPCHYLKLKRQVPRRWQSPRVPQPLGPGTQQPSHNQQVDTAFFNHWQFSHEVTGRSFSPLLTVLFRDSWFALSLSEVRARLLLLFLISTCKSPQRHLPNDPKLHLRLPFLSSAACCDFILNRKCNSTHFLCKEID